MNLKTEGIPSGSEPLPRISGLLASVAVTAVATGLCLLIDRRLDPSNLVMIYLLGVALVASRFGLYESALASVLAVIAFDFFFVEPRYTFAASNTQSLVTFGVMLTVALLISSLSIRLRAASRASEDARVQAEAEKVRNSLLSSISHDLRTPLTSIAGAASSLRDGCANERELVETIYDESLRLNHQVQNLLDMTRLHAGGVKLNLQWHSLEEIVGTAIERTRDVLHDRKVSVQMPEDLPLVQVDGALLEKVFTNLLENASQHTPPQTAISITASTHNQKLVVDVEDAGSGIRVGDESKIFDRFFRRDASRQDEHFGLGLAICKTILELHHGHIWAENRANESGAVFHVELPILEQPKVPSG